MARHAALYLRLSPRPDSLYEGIPVQEQYGREYAAAHWPDLPVVVYADPGFSAASGGPRPRYLALREQIRSGQVAQMWTIEQSRLERIEIDWFILAAELLIVGVVEVHTRRDGVLRVNDDVAGIKAVISAGEIRRLRQRIKDRLDANAAAGQPPPSIPYGLRHAVDERGGKTYEIVPEQAMIIRGVAEKVLAGWSLTSIVRHLASNGVRGSRGGTLTTTTIRSMVTTPAVAGQRLHQGRIVGRGNWPAILDESTWQACRDRLGAARVVADARGGLYAVPAPGRRAARRYLLTGGLARCGECDAEIIGTLKQLRRGQSVPYLVCSMKPRHGGKGCVGIAAVPAEAHVLATLMRQLATPAFVAAVAVDEHSERRETIGAELERLGRKRRELAARWARELTDEEWRTARDGLAAQEAELRGELVDIPPPLGDADPAVLTDPRVWAGMTLDERREMVRRFVTRVTIGRATPPYRGVDLSRVRIDWRTA
jgi:DNA invertase Pin-like site-specific DNA recombinase